MAEEYKLTYFNLRGLAEPIRFIFALAGVPYEDNRIEQENWAELKPKTRWGQLPLLTIGDQELAQSVTIGRYLARKYKLAGEDLLEEARADELIDALRDIMMQEWRQWFMENDEEKKAELKKAIIEVQIPRFFGKFNSIQEANGGQWFVGKNITCADIHISIASDLIINSFGSGVLDDYPNVLAVRDAVYALPQIKEWIEKRPETAM